LHWNGIKLKIIFLDFCMKTNHYYLMIYTIVNCFIKESSKIIKTLLWLPCIFRKCFFQHCECWQAKKYWCQCWVDEIPQVSEQFNLSKQVNPLGCTSHFYFIRIFITLALCVVIFLSDLLSLLDFTTVSSVYCIILIDVF
jgi:hypothetical protein